MLADPSSPPSVDLAVLVHSSPREANTYIDSPAFPVYMENGDRAKALIESVYDTRNSDLMSKVISRDRRDIQHSVSYLRSFRRAVVDNYAEMALTILRQINYPLDLLADVLQADRRAIGGATPATNRTAYLAVMKEFKDRSMKQELKPGAYKPEGRDHIFFYDFVTYLIITWWNSSELMANLIAADSPEFLGDVLHLNKHIMMMYLEWKYSPARVNDNSQHDYVLLMEAIGRLHESERQRPLQFLEREMATEKTDHEGFREGVKLARQKWDVIYRMEPDLDTLLSGTKKLIRDAENAGINTEEDVNRLAEEVMDLEEGKPVGIRVAARHLSSVILGRYRHLLTK